MTKPQDTIACERLRLIEEENFWHSIPVDPPSPIMVSVVIPAFRAGATLSAALRSVQNQTMRNIEIIVVDDASPDSTWDIVNDFASSDTRLRAVKHKKNQGKPVGMNRAIALARGRWLAVLDADDWYDVRRLEHLVGLGERWGYDMVSDNQFFHDAQANAIVGSAWRPGDGEWELTFDGFIEASNAYFKFNLGMLKPIIRTEFILRHSLGYEPRARNGQDFFHLLRFFTSGGTAIISDRPYYYYTQPFGIVSRRWSHATKSRYDFQTAYEINMRYLSAVGHGIKRDQRRRLFKRTQRLRTLECFFEIRDRLARNNFLGSIVWFIRRPSVLVFVLTRIRDRVLHHSMTHDLERIIARLQTDSRPRDRNRAAAQP